MRDPSSISSSSTARSRAAKRSARRRFGDIRRGVTNAAEKSSAAIARLFQLSDYARARTVMWYAGVKSELVTLPIALVANETRTVGMPFCDGESLAVYHVLDPDELTPSRWGLREPSDQVRAERARYLCPESFDVVVVPGLAFSPSGQRLGSGRGYYDRFLPRTRAGCVWIGLCFDEQIERASGALPIEAHDLAMDYVVTPSAVFDCTD